MPKVVHERLFSKPSNIKEGNMRLLVKAVLTLFVGCMTVSPLSAQTNVKESIVKIYTVYKSHSYSEPWQMSGQASRTGSGCIITGRRILTDAHVVADSTFIQVKRAGEAKRYTAEVEAVAHECDLAILKVTDDTFFSGITPVEFGALSEVRHKVAVYGFPRGGDELCITEGVVSRVEHQHYTHSGAYLLSCQIDAAINHGNSGGPVIKDNRIVGVAFQADKGENIGYMVPVPIIKHFLKDIEDSKHDGIPSLAMSFQKMENPDIRRKHHMSKEQTGILVNRIYPESPAEGILKTGDVILSVEGADVENDGTIEFRDGDRTSFLYLIQNRFIGDTVEFKILRDNGIKHVKVKLTMPMNAFRLVSNEQYDASPTYYIMGGLVFEPLTYNLLEVWAKNLGKNPVLSNLVNYYIRGEPTRERRQIVVLVKVLADEINVGYHEYMCNVISYVNGKRISTMNDLVKAFESNVAEYHTIMDERGHQIILDRNKVHKTNGAILKKYKIDSDRSQDLRESHGC
jgi:S1-C subfamily serine protease